MLPNFKETPTENASLCQDPKGTFSIPPELGSPFWVTLFAHTLAGWLLVSTHIHIRVGLGDNILIRT